MGTKAPAIAGQALDGSTFRIDFRQGKTVLVFWAAWCGPCRSEQRGIDTLAARYGSAVRFYGVDMLDHDRSLAQAFVHEFNVPYPSVDDESGAVAAAYEVTAPPSFVLVDSKGTIVARYPGETSASQLEKLIEQKLLT